MTHHDNRKPEISRRGVALMFIACLAGARTANAACQSGRFFVQGAPLVAAGGETSPDAISVDGSSVSIRSDCARVPARFKVFHGRTKLRASWTSCREPRRKVHLRAEIDEACHMTGVVRFKRPRAKLRFAANFSVCGDGIRDIDGGEACDDGNGVGGDGCEPDCTLTPSPTTTSTTTPSTTTTTPLIPPPPAPPPPSPPPPPTPPPPPPPPF